MHQTLNKVAISIGILVAGGAAACASKPTPAPVSVATTSTPTVAPQAQPVPLANGGEPPGGSEAPAPVAAEKPAPSAPVALPTTCTPQGSRKTCVPDADFAKRLCSAEYPEVALKLFAKGTPFTRAYMTRDVEGWNAGGGRTHRAKLLFDEEVLVVAHRKANANGIVMVAANGDTGSYDVLRWDGSCVSAMAEEITLSRAPKPKRAPIAWRRLEESTKSTLLATPSVKTSYDASQKACDGTNEAKCAKAEAAFNAAIVESVRNGVQLPAPTRSP